MADLIISQPMTFTVDVKNGLVERPQRESMMRGDRMANRIIAVLVDGSEPFDITGVTVKGKFCRPPNGDEIDLTGEAKANVAEVQLTDQCYTSGGHYEARVILVLGGVERTVLFISGDVLKSGSGNAAGDEETGGSGGSTGSGLPAGGTAGQVLVKVSSAQGDAIWKTLTAADVGARPDNWMPTAADVGALGKNETAVNANQLNGKDAKYYIRPRNLLVNSNFLNPVNQGGFTSVGYVTTEVPCVDRWYAAGIDSTGSVTLTSDGLVCANAYIYQKTPLDHLDSSKSYTAVFERANGEIEINNNPWIDFDHYGGGYNRVMFYNMNGTIKNIALYEGEYTADNLPPYVPKGYAAELAECMRYAVDVENAVLSGVVTENGVCEAFLPLNVSMRKDANPTVTIKNALVAYTADGNNHALTFTQALVRNTGLLLTFSCGSTINAAVNIPTFNAFISVDL